MSDRLSKVAAFILGPSAKADDDDFQSEFSQNEEDNEPTDIVDIEKARSSMRERAQVVRSGSVTSLDQRRRPARPGANQIIHERPYSFAEAARIGESFKEGAVVVLNFTATDEKQAQKLVDFCSGMAFAAQGKLERVTPKVFLLIPSSMQLTEADKEELTDAYRVHE